MLQRTRCGFKRPSPTFSTNYGFIISTSSQDLFYRNFLIHFLIYRNFPRNFLRFSDVGPIVQGELTLSLGKQFRIHTDAEVFRKFIVVIPLYHKLIHR